MRIAVGLLACLGASIANLAFADDPPAVPAPGPAAVSAPATATTAPSTPASAVAATQPASPAKPMPAVVVTADLDSKEKHFLAEGYKVEMHHGQKLYCRREEVLGSRLGAQKNCSTVEQLEQTEQDAHRALDRATFQQNNPAGH